MKNKTKGVSIGIVIIMVVVVGLIVESVFKLTVGTSRTQQDYNMWMEAKNAAEAAVEVGFAQLMSRFQTNSSFPTNALAPGQTPLSLPTRYFTTFGNKTGPWKTVTVVLPDQATYDPNSVSQWNNRPTDLMGGVVPPGTWTLLNGNQPGNEFDPLKNNLVFVRNVNVFGKASVTDWRNKHTTTAYVMETLQVRDAPLFANAVFYNMDMEIAPGAAMTVSGPVHTNYNAYVQSSAGLTFTGQFTSSGSIYHGVMSGFGKSTDNGSVSFANGSGTQVSMYQNNSWVDSNNANFRQLASQYWGGNVQSGDFGIPQMNPVGMPSYVRDNPATGTADDQLNYAYQLIQPTVPTTASNYNATIETQKFSYKAGLTVTVDTSGSNPTYTLTTYQRNADGTIKYNGSGVPLTTSLTYTGANTFISTEKYTTSGSGSNTTVTGGMYDYRRAKGIGLVKLDMGKLNTALNNNSGNQSSDWNNVSANTPSKWWNGIVYVKFSGAAPRSSDGVEVPTDNWGLQLINGSTIPNPSYTQSQGIRGTSVATNNPVYVLGNYNADGNSATGSNGTADNANEPPASIAGDSITILSTAWTNANSFKDISNRVASNFTEVSAAFLTGIVPSDDKNNNAYSGGVENFPRFLENWGSKTFRYRGSMVSLFESEVATQPWGGSNVYGAPNRDWSFSNLFSQGSYPPGTPNSRTYRRINYRELTKAQWDAQMATLKTQLGL